VESRLHAARGGDARDLRADLRQRALAILVAFVAMALAIQNDLFQNRRDEVLSDAQRAVQAAAMKTSQARADLVRLVGPELPEQFTLPGSLTDLPDVPAALQTLRAEMRERHPDLLAARAELLSAQSRVDYERQRARPAFALRAATERVPGAFDTRVGVVMSLPLFDRREGPIAQAQADVERARSMLLDRELALDQSLTIAWQRYQNALAQVNAYESGILREAQSALRVAEAAYRYGERGILDYLDAHAPPAG
jgi:cobalt-zinc-cadmium efflux system outer membrane protein